MFSRSSAPALLIALLAVGCADDGSGGVFETEALGVVEQTAVFVNECDARSTGSQPGDLIPDFSLQNCYGETVSLHDYCGRRRAIWLIGSAGWCGACAQYVPQAALEFLQTRHRGVEMFVVLSEDTNYNAPTPEYCLEYAADKGLDPARVLIDNGLSNLWRTLDPGGSTIGLPWEAVLDPYNMEYVWANSTDGGVASGVLSEMLAD